MSRSDLGNGWLARGDLDYLSSFDFRLQYSQSFNEAVFSQTHSVGFVTKHWADFGVNIVAENAVDFLSITPGNDISIRKLPELEFNQREHELDLASLPFWFSFDSSVGLLRRSQNLFQTRQFVDRLDFAPRITTALHLPGIQIVPSFGIRETSYGSSEPTPGVFAGQNILRSRTMWRWISSCHRSNESLISPVG